MPHGRILITGAAGFIGSHLADRLLARGDPVIGIDTFDPFYAPAEKRSNLEAAVRNPHFRLIEVDCTRVEAVEAALGDAPIDAVVHLAARVGVRPSVRDPMAYTHTNVTGTQAMLEVARRRRVRRFVFASSSSVYGTAASRPFTETDATDRPLSPYAATKRAGELLGSTYARLHGLSVLALRFFTVYGPRQRPDLAVRTFTERMLAGAPVPIYGDGSALRDFTWIDDLLDGVVAALDRSAGAPGEYDVINLGAGRPVSVRRLVERIAEAVGVEPVIERLPAPPGEMPATEADLTKARALLGYDPSVTIEEGIPRFVEWMRRRSGADA